ncbi:MAG: L-iditol 2-dehydrogenase [Candidatus Puniceispirillaceae bacterium]
MARLAGRVAIITGGAKGIGKAFCERFVAEGARVIIADIDRDAAEALSQKIGNEAHAVYLDVRCQDSINEMISQTKQVFGPPSILINNAALFTLAPITDITKEDYHKVFSVNVEGTLFTMQAVARDMIATRTRGAIINMASQAGRRGEVLVGAYCATKAAVISLTQSAGLGLIEYGINVNAISPGVVDTDMWEEVDALFAKYENLALGQKKARVGKAVPYGRMGHPEDLTGAAVFLASDDADYIVAQTLNVDGGNWMS